MRRQLSLSFALLTLLSLPACVLDPEKGHLDNDGDGLSAQDGDCDDEDAAVGAPTNAYPDADADGYGNGSVPTAVCPDTSGYVADGSDCNDDDDDAHADDDEVGVGVDHDCDGAADQYTELYLTTAETFYVDSDGDGFGTDDTTTEACSLPAGYARDSGDCDDGDALVNPDATEVCDDIDNNCDGAVDDHHAAHTTC